MLMFFNMEIAVSYGTYPAIIGQHFWYWVNENRKHEKNCHDGRYWVYNSVSSLRRIFPNLTEHQIRTAISKLIDSGLVIRGNYNKTRYDKTSWYSFTDLGEAVF